LLEAKDRVVAKSEIVKSAVQDPVRVATTIAESERPIVAKPKTWWVEFVEPRTRVIFNGVTGVLARRWAIDEVNFVLSRRRLDMYAVKCECSATEPLDAPTFLLSFRFVYSALAAFIAASYTEDTYGQAQQVIPASLEALAKYHDALVSYDAEFSFRARQRGPLWSEAAREVWTTEVDPVKKSKSQCFKELGRGASVQSVAEMVTSSPCQRSSNQYDGSSRRSAAA
jgi:hypothetical protein